MASAAVLSLCLEGLTASSALGCPLGGFILETDSCKKLVYPVVSLILLCSGHMAGGASRCVSVCLGKQIESTGFGAPVAWCDSPLRHRKVE